MKFCCCPFSLKAKYHPWIYIAIFCVINYIGAIAMVSGFIVGYLYVYHVLDGLQVSDSTAQSMEDSSCCINLAEHPTFIRVNDASKNEIAGTAGIGLNMPNYARQQNEAINRGSGGETSSNVHAIGGNHQSQSNYNPFAGHGVKVGGEAGI